jgi:GNAT superfamily N-acetyltransferase
MKNILITPVEEKDMEEIYALYQEFAIYEKLEDYFSASLEDMRRLMFQDGLLCMMKAELEGKLVGFAAYYYQLVSFPAKKVLYLEDIFVKEEARGQGIGNLFLQKLEELAKKKNCIKMMWKCLAWNQTSRNFYEHIGAKLDTEWVIYEKYFD